MAKRWVKDSPTSLKKKLFFSSKLVHTGSVWLKRDLSLEWSFRVAKRIIRVTDDDQIKFLHAFKVLNIKRTF